jgi:hypothetical protein
LATLQAHWRDPAPARDLKQPVFRFAVAGGPLALGRSTADGCAPTGPPPRNVPRGCAFTPAPEGRGPRPLDPAHWQRRARV